jgi:phage baseplate assembly protein W
MSTLRDIDDFGNTIEGKGAASISIKNICLTDVGTMPGLPTYGVGINSLLFENMDIITINNIKDAIINKVETHDPRLIIDNVDVQAIPEFNKLVINVDYSHFGQLDTAIITVLND